VSVPDVALVALTSALTEANDFAALEHAFAGVGPVMSVPMYGFYALDAESPRIARNVGVNVSDPFVARYEAAMELDPLIEVSRTTQGAAYNLALMSADEWRESEIFRRAYAVHSMQHVVEVAIVGDDEVLGALHLAASAPDREMTDKDLALAEAIANVLAHSIARIRRRDELASELDGALAALELTKIAVVRMGSQSTEPRLNDAARDLLASVTDGQRHLFDLLARPPVRGAFGRRADVEMKTGGSATLHAHSMPMRDGGLVTVLELQPEHPSVRADALARLSPREAQVATSVVEGLSDREIAEHLVLSPHTVSQHVGSIYRKLGVGSRVELTRVLLSPPPHVRAS
jgi:DNA-binding CsgD family transcriptional regulator